MLVLSRKLREVVVIGGADGVKCLLKITVLANKRGSVKLGFEAAPELPVHRGEVWDRLTNGGLPDKAAEGLGASLE